MYVMIKVHLEGYINGSGLDIALDGRDMRSEFGCTTLYAISGQNKLEVRPSITSHFQDFADLLRLFTI